MRKLFKVLAWLVFVLVMLVVVLFGYVQLTWNKTYDAPYPDIAASNDSAVIERGKYLAYGMAHCASCHVPMDKIMDVEKGQQIPLSGGWEEEVPGLGTFRAPNLTPDPETGIGNMTDGELARAVRYSVKHDGKFLPPFMVFQGMTDADLTAVISFLRSQPPVKHKVEPTDYTLMAKALLAFGILKPEGPKSTPPASISRDTTAAYGHYLANSIGNCLGCHISRDNTGRQINPDFAGGGIFPPNSLSNGYAFISPNITPHKGTGVIAEWSQETFVQRFKGGRLHEGSPMPWGMYARMDESDLKALYQYLHSLEPVENKVAKTVFTPGEKFPPEPAGE